MNKGLRKMNEFASLYGCEIVELWMDEGDTLYARPQGVTDHSKQQRVCSASLARDVDLNKIKGILERVSGRTLAQFWTGR